MFDGAARAADKNAHAAGGRGGAGGGGRIADDAAGDGALGTDVDAGRGRDDAGAAPHGAVEQTGGAVAADAILAPVGFGTAMGDRAARADRDALACIGIGAAAPEGAGVSKAEA